MENVEKHSWFHVVITVLTGILKFISKMILFLITAFLYVLTFLLKIPLFFIYWAKNIFAFALILIVIYTVLAFTYYCIFPEYLDNGDMFNAIYTQQKMLIFTIVTVVLAGFTAFNQVRHLTYDDMD